MRRATVTIALTLLALGNARASAQNALAHAVTLRVESLSSPSVTFHVIMRPAEVARFPGEVTPKAESSYSSPALIPIGSRVMEVDIVTDRNQPVKVTFEEGSSAAERAQRVWGRQIFLRRKGADLVPESKAIQIVPAQ